MRCKERSVISRLLLAALLSCFVVDEASARGRWAYANRMQAHYGRAGLAAAIGPDGTIYAIGGNTVGDPDVIGTVEAYDYGTDTWVTKSPMPTARTGLAAATGLDGRIYAIGGCPASHGYIGLDTVEVYDPATDTWSVAAPMPTARTGLKAVTGTDGRIYAIGGYNGQVGHLNVVEVYDPNTNTWTTASPMPTARQQFGATLGPDGHIYAIGGSNQWRNGILNVVEVYDPVADAWKGTTSMPTPRDGVGVTIGPDGLIYAIGGFSFEAGPFGDVTPTVEAYDITTGEWRRMPSLINPEYGPATVTGADDRIYAIGGGGYGVSSLVQVYSCHTPKR